MSDDHNPYAPPAPEDDKPRRRRRAPASTDATNAWQQDGQVVAPRFGAELPDRCVVCNRRTQSRIDQTFQWHHPAYYILICGGWIVYLIAMLMVRKTSTMRLPLCEDHLRRRKNGLTLLWASLGVGFFLVVISALGDLPALIGVAVLGMFVGIFVGALQARVATVAKMDEQHIWLKAGPDFVASLPDSPDDEPAPRPRKKKRPKKPAADPTD
jgi:hypothetical protein